MIKIVEGFKSYLNIKLLILGIVKMKGILKTVRIKISHHETD